MTKERKKRTVTVYQDTWEKLTLRKFHLHFNTIDEVVNDLLKKVKE
jgi:hypothetical protein